jgi:tetratricopeptide (TPR) repeat protein/PleD family two-component response regulator
LALDSAHNARELTFGDLQRFEETIKPPFRRALQVGRVDLLPTPSPDPESSDPLARATATGKAVFDERGGRLVVPMLTDSRPLALLVVWGVEAGQLPPAVSGFLSSLVESSLEMVRLRLAAETDAVTGLNNEQALDAALTTAISRLSSAKVRGRPALDQEKSDPGLSLLALEPRGMDTLRERYGLRFGNVVMAQIAKKVREALPEALCAAYVGGSFLVLLSGGAGQAGQASGRLRQAIESLELTTPEGRNWPAKVGLGAATMDSRSREGGGLASEAAAMLKARSLRALACATRLGRDQILFFREIVEKAGRLKEIMPMDRVLVDLGRIHGLSEGERFQVVATSADPNGSETAKAEVVVVSVGEEDSVAEVASLLDPTFSLRPGDRLRLLGQEGSAPSETDTEKMIAVGEKKVKVLLDEVSGLPGHRSFVALFSALCQSNLDFSAGLLRVEGLEGMREVCGTLGAESLVKGLADASQQVLPKRALLGRFAPDTLGVLLPGRDPEHTQELLKEVLAQVGKDLERPLRAGVAGHPCPGFQAADTLDNAAKALVHAGFLEPGSVVIFDAVSLNVSGDALFAQGRISEAVVEYEKALVLQPQEPNVLNSLGVCYGHLGQTLKALEFFEKALEAAPEDFMAYYNLGYALMARGKMAEARQHLEKSLSFNPDHADTLFQLGRLAQSEGKLNEAMDYFNQAAQQDGCRRAVHRHLGEAMAAAGRFAEAEESFNQAVKINPNDAAALASLAGLYLDRNANLEIALSLGRRAHQLEPSAPRHYRVMARALTALKRLEEAGVLLNQAVTEHAQDPFLAVQRAQVLAAGGDKAAAKDELTRALSLEPNLESARQELAALERDSKAK